MVSNSKSKLALIALTTALIAGRACAEDLNCGPPRYVPPSALIISTDPALGMQRPTQGPVPEGRNAQRHEFADVLRNKYASAPCADQGFRLPSVGSEGPTIGRAPVCDHQVWQRTSGGFDW